jgi:hypothetical protein
LTIPEGSRCSELMMPMSPTSETHTHDPTTVVSDFNSTTFENQLSPTDNTGTGDVLKYEPGGDTQLSQPAAYIFYIQMGHGMKPTPIQQQLQNNCLALR